MLTTAPLDYGVADPAEARLMSGSRVPRGDDGRPAARAADRADAFVLAHRGRRRLRRVRGRRRRASSQPARRRPRRLGADLDRQRRPVAPARRCCPAGSSYTTIETKANFSRPITKDAGRVRAEGRVDRPRPAHHLLRGADRRRARPSAGARDVDADGFGGGNGHGCFVRLKPRRSLADWDPPESG